MLREDTAGVRGDRVPLRRVLGCTSGVPPHALSSAEGIPLPLALGCPLEDAEHTYRAKVAAVVTRSRATRATTRAKVSPAA